MACSKALMKEGNERLRGGGHRIKFIDFRFERTKTAGVMKEEGKTFHGLQVLAMDDDCVR